MTESAPAKPLPVMCAIQTDLDRRSWAESRTEGLSLVSECIRYAARIFGIAMDRTPPTERWEIDAKDRGNTTQQRNTGMYCLVPDKIRAICFVAILGCQ